MKFTDELKKSLGVEEISVDPYSHHIKFTFKDGHEEGCNTRNDSDIDRVIQGKLKMKRKEKLIHLNEIQVKCR